MMKVAIKGNLAQVRAVLDPTPINRRAPKNSGRNAVIREQHAILRRAFEIVRRDPDAKEDAEEFLAALVGRTPRTKGIIDRAQRLISSSEGGR